MKPKTILLTLALFFATASVCLAQGVQMGTWKLNEAKSKIAPGGAKNHTVVYEAAGDMIKIIVDGTNSDGSAAHNEWTGKFDGKDYPVTGDPTSDARAYRQLNARTLVFDIKKDGKIIVNGRVVVSKDGKTRTVTTTGTDSQGKKFKSVGVYDKQ
jgi:hypothetical protein